MGKAAENYKLDKMWTRVDTRMASGQNVDTKVLKNFKTPQNIAKRREKGEQKTDN